MEKSNLPPEIPSFTIPDLFALGDLAVIPHFGTQLIAKCESVMEPFRYPCRIDAIIISLCTEGECTVFSNLRNYNLTKGSIFISGPKNILHFRSTPNFRTDVLVIAPELLGEAHIDLKNLMPLLIEFGNQSCLPLSEEDQQALHNLIAQIETEIQSSSETVFTKGIVGGLLSASVAKIGDLLLRYLEQHPESNGSKRNRNEECFIQFMQCLAEHYRQERSVNFYAHRMCITPKYLTTLIKHVSGKSASEWICDYVVLEAKTLLKYSNMSIQEIAYFLNFPNQSFFGSYFKRSTGFSPSQYQKQGSK